MTTVSRIFIEGHIGELVVVVETQAVTVTFHCLSAINELCTLIWRSCRSHACIGDFHHQRRFLMAYRSCLGSSCCAGQNAALTRLNSVNSSSPKKSGPYSERKSLPCLTPHQAAVFRHQLNHFIRDFVHQCFLHRVTQIKCRTNV